MMSTSPGISTDPFFVVNPHSANGATRARFLELVPSLRQAFPDMAYAFTAGPMHAAQLAVEAIRSGARTVVACGGDGTLNEVTAGLVDAGLAAQAVLAVMPSGTGGDFRKVIGLGPGPVGAIECLRSGRARPIDVGMLYSEGLDGKPLKRAFINIASFGISGVVDHYVNHTTKVLGGKVSFLVGTLRGMMAYKNVRMKITVDGHLFHEGPTNLVAVGNGRFFGGGMMITPHAELGDGLFDITVFGDMSKLQFMGLSGAIYKGAHLDRPNVKSTRGRVVEVVGETEALIDIDGEAGGRLPARAEILPNAIQLLMPA